MTSKRSHYPTKRRLTAKQKVARSFLVFLGLVFALGIMIPVYYAEHSWGQYWIGESIIWGALAFIGAVIWAADNA